MSLRARLAAVGAAFDNPPTPPTPSKPPGLTHDEAVEAYRAGKLLYDSNRRLVSTPRRAKRALMREHGITSGRQWVRLRKNLRLSGAR